LASRDQANQAADWKGGSETPARGARPGPADQRGVGRRRALAERRGLPQRDGRSWRSSAAALFRTPPHCMPRDDWRRDFRGDTGRRSSIPARCTGDGPGHGASGREPAAERQGRKQTISQPNIRETDGSVVDPDGSTTGSRTAGSTFTCKKCRLGNLAPPIRCPDTSGKARWRRRLRQVRSHFMLSWRRSPAPFDELKLLQSIHAPLRTRVLRHVGNLIRDKLPILQVLTAAAAPVFHCPVSSPSVNHSFYVHPCPTIPGMA
jgi:hypothetical protein